MSFSFKNKFLELSQLKISLGISFIWFTTSSNKSSETSLKSVPFFKKPSY
ncbi:hypothetical protein MSHv_04090 [Mycoplasmopsis synoviae]|nr:hypothetical protein MSHv_04090 [Mycoplasmopsis synoviae]AQU48206.1 hypothetical protein ADF19_04090 [Mycoplasmopsis synoviae]